MLLNYHGLKFIFNDLKSSQNVKENFSITAFQNGEKLLMNKYGKQAKRPAKDYIDLAFHLMEKKNQTSAITVLDRATKAYPKYIGLLTTLAKLYEKTQQLEKAIATYHRAVTVSKKLKLGQESGLQTVIKNLQKTKSKK